MFLGKSAVLRLFVATLGLQVFELVFVLFGVCARMMAYVFVRCGARFVRLRAGVDSARVRVRPLSLHLCAFVAILGFIVVCIRLLGSGYCADESVELLVVLFASGFVAVRGILLLRLGCAFHLGKILFCSLSARACSHYLCICSVFSSRAVEPIFLQCFVRCSRPSE